MKIAVSLLLAVTGGLLAAIPRLLFPTCGFASLPGHMGGGMMRCDSTGTATLVLGLLTLAAAILSLLPEVRIRRAALCTAFGAALAIFPFFGVWPGVCRTITMPCRVGTLPVALLVAGLQLVVAGGALALEYRQSGNRKR
jgi:hypothetical protein